MVHQKRKSRHILKIPERSAPSGFSTVNKSGESTVDQSEKNESKNQTKDDAVEVMNEYYQRPEKHDKKPSNSSHEAGSENGDSNEDEMMVSDAIPEAENEEEESSMQQSFFIQSNDDDSSRSSSELGNSDTPCITKFECVLCDMVFEVVDEFKEHVDTHASGVVLKAETGSLNEPTVQIQSGSHGLPAFEIQNEEDIDTEDGMDEYQKTVSKIIGKSSQRCGYDHQDIASPSLPKLDYVKRGKLKKMFLCRYCGKKFMGESFLEEHLITIYKNITGEDNDQSHQKLKEIPDVEELRKNIRLHMYSIEYGSSGKKKSTKESLKSESTKTEMSTVGEKSKVDKKRSIGSLECKYCGRNFVYRKWLYCHQVNCSECPESGDESENEPQDIEPSRKVDLELPCTRCNSVFKSAEDLIKHRETIHNAKCPKEDENIEYFCAHCNLQCASQAKLYSHLQTHRNNKKTRYNKGEYQNMMTVDKSANLWVCNICEKAYSNKSNLKRHISLHDLDERKEFKCPFCSRVFQYQRYLQHHIGYMHKTKEEKEHECYVCGLTCTTSGSLKRHMMLHTGDLELTKVFECEICHKKFKYKKELENHVHYHLDERPYPCNKCDYRARTYFNLMNHFGTHFKPRKKRKADKHPDEKPSKITAKWKVDQHVMEEVESITTAVTNTAEPEPS